MATAQMSADTSRLSFAKVAASAGKENVALSSFARGPGATPIREARKDNIQTESQDDANDVPQHSNGSVHARQVNAENTSGASTKSMTTKREGSQLEGHANQATLVEAVKALVVNSPMPSLVVNGSGIPDVKSKGDVAVGLIEDAFPRGDSGSELGTKPPSLDGKSITSGTTFALDEKESLRPDDSASVKAAEDDDAFSGRGSIVAASRIGSEEAARAYRAQFYEAPERRSVTFIQGQQAQETVMLSGCSPNQQMPEDGKAKPLSGGTGEPEAFNLFYRQTPDEKLLEALESPKDRIFLLRLEQDVIEFVRSSTEPFIDLPPCNSFCRMLTHKLADYYHMTHQVDAVAGAVRIFRTPFCRLPQTLSSISNPPTSGNTPPPIMPAMKIMRRGDEGDTGPSPSKATSETGSDGKDKSLSAKEKLSREEREAAYNKARERIFGKEEKSGDATPETEEGNEMSRSSSISTKDRAAQSKRLKAPKQRRDDSENFDVRSQYTPFFPQQQAPTWVPTTQYPMAPQQFSGVMQNNYQMPMPQQFVAQPQQYNAVMMNNSNPQMFNSMPQQYAQYQQQNQQRVQHHSAPISAYGSPVQSQPLPVQQWPQQSPYQSPYQQQGPVGRGPVNPIPYAFGQLPSTVNPANPKSQHPIPGSFNRHAFNPKTQSFVPGSGGVPIAQPMSHHGSPHHSSPHHGSPHLSYNAFSAPPQQFGNNMGYNMARQGSNNSLPSYHASPLMAQRPMMHQGLPQGMPQGIVQNLPQNLSHVMQAQSNGQVGSLLPNYGNPSTLPPKPPTGI